MKTNYKGNVEKAIISYGYGCTFSCGLWSMVHGLKSQSHKNLYTLAFPFLLIINTIQIC